MTTKTLFITGASSGIGAETARAAAEAGWNVALFARSQDKLEALVAGLGETRALALPGDVTQIAELDHAVRETQARFGQINAVFANAGRGLDTPGVAEGDPEEWRSMMDINVMGLLFTVKASYAALQESKGHLILTGSAAGKRHIKGSIYGASKWFVHGFGGNMAEEMREWGGRCTVIAPGMVDTPFFDSPKPDKLQPEDVAHAVMHALSAPERASVQEIFLMPTQ
ncbi:NADP-dependent 3-hydroxy acid dehydrogenase YdfG [Roseovarius tolerans]|uniref:NADP-dependent 3-hydroxy acid dehydrogenase YdfG n=1 Tax=Roseovarius tolerans TaxID=74031 RepID=A0A1H8G4Q7_9RHOB|nr:SDR family oxidoreductase [Roseovarius tolerans]SEN39081.1 NADP-dependent 3-hydroxy acid dehydrogenase YdfG [Roseovarius tolerans]